MGAEILWDGSENARLQWLVPNLPPAMRHIAPELGHSSQARGRAKAFLARAEYEQSGPVYDADLFNMWTASGGWTRRVTLDADLLQQIATQATARAGDAVKTLESTLVDFRNKIKNDITSIKAAAERVQDETLRMRKQYEAAAAALTSPEFVRAVENAERMARALEQISGLSQTKISLAVFGEPQRKETP